MNLIKCLLSVLILYVLLAASDALECHQVHNNIDLLNPNFTNYGDRRESCSTRDTSCVTLNGTYSGQNLLIKGCWSDFVSLNISTYIIGFTACSNNKQTFSHPNSKLPYNVDVYCCTTDNCNFPTTQNTSDALECHQVHNNIDLLNPNFTNYGDRNETCPSGDTTCVTLNGTYSGQNLLIKGCWSDFVSLNISTYIIGFNACYHPVMTFGSGPRPPLYIVDVYCCTKDNCNFPITQGNRTQANGTCYNFN